MCSVAYAFSFLVLLLLIGIGCAPAPTPVPPTAPATATQPSPTATQPRPTATLPPPTYTPVANTTASQLIGSWAYIQGDQKREINLLADGTWYLRVNENRENDGVYMVTGDQFSITDNQNRRDSCRPSDNPGVYQWTLDGKKLSLTAVNELCMQRKGVLADPRWARQ